MDMDHMKELCGKKALRWTNHKGFMTCFVCKGSLEDKATTFMVDLDNCIVIIKNVPSQVCAQCGETSYSNDVARQLERIVSAVKSAAFTEIAVVNYEEKVA
jgi:YgiT-type zinc finger domain-containing protein